jgi:glutamine amidotransferase
VIGDLGALERELGDDMALVGGDTDSERFFALITREIERGGDVGEGITTAARWVAAHLPVFAINCVLITASDLWALRYPDTHELHTLERAAGGPTGSRHLEHASARGTIRVRSGHLASRPAVVVATERMDEDAGWKAMEPGELLHVDGSLKVTRRRVLSDPPAHPLTLADLDPHAAASQQPSSASPTVKT